MNRNTATRCFVSYTLHLTLCITKILIHLNKVTSTHTLQRATTVPKNASISDLLLPTENVYYVSGQYGGWRESYLVPCVYKTPEAFNAEAPSLVGKTMTIMMPIMIENVQNDYTFTFNIDKLLNEAGRG